MNCSSVAGNAKFIGERLSWRVFFLWQNLGEWEVCFETNYQVRDGVFAGAGAGADFAHHLFQPQKEEVKRCS